MASSRSTIGAASSGSGRGDLDCDDVPQLCDDSDNDDAEWDDIDGDDENERINVLTGDIVCLFCTHMGGSVDLILKHCKDIHCFDMVKTCKIFSVDSIEYIRLINFIRKQKPSPKDLEEAFKCGGKLWAGDDYMETVNPSDLMLQFDIESAVENHQVLLDIIDFTESEIIAALVNRLQKADEEQSLLKKELRRAVDDLNKLRLSGQELIMKMNIKDPREDLGYTKGVNHSNDSLNEEDGYFASYTHHDIHATMLKDKVRTESYRNFMLCNSHLFEGKTVLDVGCGTGILSMFAVQAGASHVVSVDQSNIIYQAMDIARENKMHEKISFVKGKLEDVTLPFDKFDIIISEWMGYFLLFEAMLDSVLWARDRYLAPGGCVYPDHFTMNVVGVEDQDLHKSRLEFWDDVYGFRMSCMKTSVLDEVYVKHVKSSTIVTQPAVIKDINIQSCKVSELDFITEFNLKCLKDATITAIVGYFITDFDTGCQKKISFSTGPEVPPTHWEQAIMLLQKPLTVKAGSSEEGKIIYRKHPQDLRGILVSLTFGKQTMKYNLF